MMAAATPVLNILGGILMTEEIKAYVSVLCNLRDQVKKMLAEWPSEALDWRPIEGQGDLATNSAAIITAHLAGSETFWMKEVIGRQPIHRDRDAELRTKGKAASGLGALLDGAAKTTEEVLSSLKPEQLNETRQVRDRTVTVRWSILHVIEHVAIHLGHLQLMRQLWMIRQ